MPNRISTLLTTAICLAACNGSGAAPTRADAAGTRTAPPSTTASSPTAAPSGGGPVDASGEPASKEAIFALPPKSGSLPAGYAWAAKTWPPGYAGWEAAKAGSGGIVRLDVLDCRQRNIVSDPGEMGDGMTAEPACASPPAERWEGYPALREKDKTLKVRAGNMLVTARAEVGSPYASDAKLAEVMRLLDLAALAKL